MGLCDYCHRHFYGDGKFCSKTCADLWRAEWYEKRKRRDIDEVEVEEFIDEANKSNAGQTKAGRVSGKVASVSVGIAGKIGTKMLDEIDQEASGTWVPVLNKGIRLAGKGIGKLIVHGASKSGDAAANAISKRKDSDYDDEYDDEYEDEYEDEYDENDEIDEDIWFYDEDAIPYTPEEELAARKQEYFKKHKTLEGFDAGNIFEETKVIKTQEQPVHAQEYQEIQMMEQKKELAQNQYQQEPQVQYQQNQFTAESQNESVMDKPEEKENYEKLDFSGITEGLMNNSRKLMNNSRKLMKNATSSFSNFAGNAKESAKESAEILKESSKKIGENFKSLFKKKD